MRYFFIVLIALLGMQSSVFAQSKLLHDKTIISFEVLLDNKPVGAHTFSIERSKNIINVHSKMQLRIKFLGLFPVSYFHESSEYWRDGCLIGLEATTKERGKAIRVSAQLKDKALEIVSADGIDTLQGCIKSFAYWDPNLLSGERLLNTENGELVSVNIKTINNQNDGSKSVVIENSEADIYLEYSSADQWLSLKSQLKVGGDLHYIRQ